jgi:hypothetical protein
MLRQRRGQRKALGRASGGIEHFQADWKQTLVVRAPGLNVPLSMIML